MVGINRVILGGNLGGEIRGNNTDYCSFLLFTNDVTPPPDTPIEETALWKNDNPAIVRVHVHDGHATRKIATLGRGAFILLEGELMTRKKDSLFVTDVRMKKLMFWNPPIQRDDTRREEGHGDEAWERGEGRGDEGGTGDPQ